ncbi:MAG TPA: hypothetical protein V6C58_23375 [Allocoleopsis sp.]
MVHYAIANAPYKRRAGDRSNCHNNFNFYGFFTVLKYHIFNLIPENKLIVGIIDRPKINLRADVPAIASKRVKKMPLFT